VCTTYFSSLSSRSKDLPRGLIGLSCSQWGVITPKQIRVDTCRVRWILLSDLELPEGKNFSDQNWHEHPGRANKEERLQRLSSKTNLRRAFMERSGFQLDSSQKFPNIARAGRTRGHKLFDKGKAATFLERFPLTATTSIAKKKLDGGGRRDCQGELHLRSIENTCCAKRR